MKGFTSLKEVLSLAFCSDNKESGRTRKVCFETPLFSSSILLKDKKTKECVKLIIVLSKNKTRYLKRVSVYNPPTIQTRKHCKFTFKSHHRENGWERKSLTCDQ